MLLYRDVADSTAGSSDIVKSYRSSGADGRSGASTVDGSGYALASPLHERTFDPRYASIPGA